MSVLHANSSGEGARNVEPQGMTPKSITSSGGWAVLMRTGVDIADEWRSGDERNGRVPNEVIAAGEGPDGGDPDGSVRDGVTCVSPANGSDMGVCATG